MSYAWRQWRPGEAGIQAVPMAAENKVNWCGVLPGRDAMSDSPSVDANPVPSDSAELAWVTPGVHGTPAQALSRIRALCQQLPDLHSVLLAVLATHQGLAREILGVAVKQFRRDLDDLSPADVASLLTSLWNGGKQGFEATLRSRRKSERKGAALPWVKSD